MKKLFPLFLIAFLLCLGFSNSIIAQSTNKLLCGESGQYSRVIGLNCFSLEDAPTLDDADLLLEEVIEGVLVCSPDSCLNPRKFKCDPSITFWPDGYPPYDSTDTQICYEGQVTVDWKCSECLYVRPVRDTIVEDTTISEPPRGRDLIELESTIEIHESDQPTNTVGSIAMIAPNPTNGPTRVSLNIGKEKVDRIELSVFDLQGKRILYKPYGQTPASIFHGQIDLSDLPPGAYFLRVEADKTLLGSAKVFVQ